MDIKKFVLSFIVFIIASALVSLLIQLAAFSIGSTNPVSTTNPLYLKSIIANVISTVIAFYLALRVYGIRNVDPKKFLLSYVVLIMLVLALEFLLTGGGSYTGSTVQYIARGLVSLVISLVLLYLGLRIYGVEKRAKK